MKSIHKTVLLNETIEGLNLKNGATVIDGTFGGGGHSAEVCKRWKGIKIIAIDKDKSALERAKDKFEKLDCEVNFINSDFRNLDKTANEVDGIILDLGLSSDQLDSSGRGFSFMKDEPLEMTMKEDPSPEDTRATEIVNKWSEKSLADIIYGYGEEKYSRRIAKAIVDSRKKKEIKTTFDLLKIISEAVPTGYKKGKLHYATRTFQALRIATNDELGALKEGLEKGYMILKSGGRMSVISFHSLEDRIVKNFFKSMKLEGKGKLINKKPITPSKEELKINNRSRSAKLRIIEKI